MIRTRLSLAAIAAIAAVVGAAPGLAVPRVEKASVELRTDRTAFAPGESGRVAAIMTVEEGWHTNSHRPTYEFLIPTELTVTLPSGWEPAQVSYPDGDVQPFTFAEEPLSVYHGRVVLPAAVTVPADAPAGEVPVRASLTYQACDDSTCLPPVTKELEAVLTVGPGGQPVDLGAAPPVSAGAPGGRSLPVILALALVGGLILNAMPCVLPVLSLKVFSLVKSAALSRREVVVSGLATASGILVSFWALALAAVAARSAGEAVGWGVQFQRPGFVAFLAVVVVLFTLNLWGLFEVQLPWRLAQVAGRAQGEGVSGHFVSGLFATLMATPCSAPFLGPAVGFAMTQPAGTILGVFTALGIGMALPYLVLAARPGLARFFPRPGDWMIRLKEVMGFLLAGTAIWLFYVLAAQVSPERLAFVQAALIGLALAVWLGRQWRHAALKRLAWLGVVAAAAGTLWLAATAPPPRSSELSGEAAGHVAWTSFDRGRLDAHVAAGTPVFVDVTADWCFTCKVNERLVLDTPEVAAALEGAGVVAMRADWTNRNETIGTFLAEHGRYGIPFYVLYRPGTEPVLFSELLSKETVLAELAALPAIATTPPAAGLGADLLPLR